MWNPMTRTYDCHCGARFATVCRLRHWLNSTHIFSSPVRSFLIAITFLTWASGAPNRLNGCKKFEEEPEMRQEWIEAGREYHESQPTITPYDR